MSTKRSVFSVVASSSSLKRASRVSSRQVGHRYFITTFSLRTNLVASEMSMLLFVSGATAFSFDNFKRLEFCVQLISLNVSVFICAGTLPPFLVRQKPRSPSGRKPCETEAIQLYSLQSLHFFCKMDKSHI